MKHPLTRAILLQATTLMEQEIDRLRAELAAMRPVAEAAVWEVDHEPAIGRTLRDAVREWREITPPESEALGTTPDTCTTAHLSATVKRHPAGDLIRVTNRDGSNPAVFTAADFAELAEIAAKLKPQGPKPRAAAPDLMACEKCWTHSIPADDCTGPDFDHCPRCGSSMVIEQDDEFDPAIWGGGVNRKYESEATNG